MTPKNDAIVCAWAALPRAGRGAGATRLALLLLLAAFGGQPSARAIAEARAAQWAQRLKSTPCSEFYKVNILGHWLSYSNYTRALTTKWAQIRKSTLPKEFHAANILGH